MKKTILFFCAILLLCGIATQTKAQSIAQELTQLELDYQKLDGLKSILKQMYAAYELVNNGYNAVKNVSNGNFNLHQNFLNALMVVSPTVRKYEKVVAIANNQIELVSEYKSAYSIFKQDGHFQPDEISYIIDVYNNLVSSSLNNLSALTNIISDNQLRMSDAERIHAIDQLYATSQTQLSFLRQFNNSTETVAIQRAQQANDQQTLRTIYGIH